MKNPLLHLTSCYESPDRSIEIHAEEIRCIRIERHLPVKADGKVDYTARIENMVPDPFTTVTTRSCGNFHVTESPAQIQKYIDAYYASE